MARLHAIIAIEKGEKAKRYEAVTARHQKVQKRELLSGQTRTYRPKNDEGDRLPGESQIVQVRAEEELRGAADDWTRIIDLLATKEAGNTLARADLVAAGTVLVKDVPVTTLLGLEKILIDMRTFITKLPTLDPSVAWVYSADAGVYRSDPVETTRTRKVLRNHVKAEATERHPAQVETYSEDVIEGYWTTIRLSGAMPADDIRRLADRVDTLLAAVKVAREAANMTEVADQRLGAALMGYLLAPK